MSNLGPQRQNASFNGLLQIPGGVTAQLQQVQDGEGRGTGLFLSSAGVNATTSNSFVASVSGTSVTGAVPRLISDGFGDMVSVKDFGATGDGVTDDYAAFQAAVNTTKLVFVPPGDYYISQTIVMALGYSGLVGHQRMPRIKIDAANGPAVKVTATGSALNEFSRIENIIFRCNGKPSFSPTPNSTNCGIAIDGSPASVAAAVQRFLMYNCRILGFSCGINVASTVNTCLEHIFIEQHTDWSGESGYTAANLYVGVNFDLTPYTPGGISPQASIECVNICVNGRGAPSAATSQCFRLVGEDPRDIFFDRCETAGGNYGWYIQPTSNNYNFDLHIRRPIIDAVSNVGIYVLNWGGYGALTIDGGYIVKSANNTGAGIWIDSSTGVTVTGGLQLIGLALNGVTNDEGIRIRESTAINVNSTLVTNCRYGISVEGSNSCVIANNTVTAGVGSFETAPVLAEGIRLFAGTAATTGNTVIGNVVKGVNSTYKYVYGVTTDSTAANNTVANNQVDYTTVTNPYSFGNNNNFLVYQQQAIATIKSNKVELVSVGGQATYQGNDATYPHKFLDGSGGDLVGLTNAGAWVVLSDRALKEDVAPIAYGLDEILKLEPKSYLFTKEKAIADNGRSPVRLGLIAQDVAEVIPEVVGTLGEFKGIDYTSIIPVLINALKQLNEKVTLLSNVKEPK